MPICTMAMASSMQIASTARHDQASVALFGRTTTKQAAVYTRKANRTKLESEAARLLEAQASNESAHFFSDSVRSENEARKSLL